MAEITESITHTYELGRRAGFLRKLIFMNLAKMKKGTICIDDKLGTNQFGVAGTNYPKAQVTVHDPRFFGFLAFRGALGASEAFMLGYWSSPNLKEVVRMFALNQEAMTHFEKGLALLTKPSQWVFSYFNRNTLLGSQRNIRAHYDLSNKLFEKILDKNMMYSCAYFKENTDTLDEAAENKLERICKKLELKSTDHLLEIGTGWGGMAIYAAQKYGCHVTTTTISKEQYDYAKAKIADLGLEKQITLLFKDYRKLKGKYDKAVSIEMVEAVGAGFLDQYMQTCSNLLKPEGVFLMQAITINDQAYHRALKEVDFIKKYIFPGSFIPSLQAINTAQALATDMRMYHFEDMTAHYEKTLMAWRKNFFSNHAVLEEMGFDSKFKRMWDYYFCYCAGGFAERAIGAVQIVFGKPEYRQDLSIKSEWR